MKYLTLFLVSFAPLCSAACLLVEDVEEFLLELDRTHFAGIETGIDSPKPGLLRYSFNIEEGVTGSILWCWRRAVASDGSVLDCLSPAPIGASIDYYHREDEKLIGDSLESVVDDYLQFVEAFDIEPELLAIDPPPMEVCKAQPASNKSQQEAGG